MIMTPAGISTRVAQIRNAWSVDLDDSKAHALEDNLFLEVLSYIATAREPKAAALAKEALRSLTFKFSRGCV